MLSFLKLEITLREKFFLLTGYSWLLMTTFMVCCSKIYKTDSDCCLLGRLVSYTTDYDKNYFRRCSPEGNSAKKKKKINIKNRYQLLPPVSPLSVPALMTSKRDKTLQTNKIVPKTFTRKKPFTESDLFDTKAMIIKS